MQERSIGLDWMQVLAVVAAGKMHVILAVGGSWMSWPVGT